MSSRRGQAGLAGMGFDLAAAVGVATLLGWWIDRQFDTEPWGLIICAMVGIVGGLLNFVRAGKQAAEQAARQATSRQPTKGEEFTEGKPPAGKAGSKESGSD